MKMNGSAEMLIHLKLFTKLLETELDVKIKQIRIDDDSEYKRFIDAYLKEEGINHEIIAFYHSDQNGVVEWANRIIMNRIRAIIEDAQFPRELWDEIAMTIVYLKNLNPTTILDNLISHKVWYGIKSNLQHLRILDYTTYVHVPEEKRIKLDNHTIKDQLIGYEGINQWKVWIPEKEEVVISRDVIFDEEEDEKLMIEVSATTAKPVIHPEIRVLPGPSDQYPTPPTTIPSRTASPEKSPSTSEISETFEDEEPQQSAKSAAKKKSTPPPPSCISERSGKGQHIPWFGETVAKLAQTSNPDDKKESTTYREATTHSTRAKEWEKVIMNEYNSIMRNNTWRLIPKSTNWQIIICKWIFKHKKDQFDRITRLKARFVAREFS